MHQCSRLILACTLLVAATVNPAIAGVVRIFDVSVGIQPANVGTITLTQNSASVDVSVDLLDGYGFLNTGGPHTPFAFNLTGSGTLSISPFSTPAGGVYADGTFSLNTGGGSNVPFGIFGVALDSSAANGSGTAYYGDLLFTLNRTGGLDTDDFIQNADGYLFSADLTDGQNTGAQAWGVSQVPIPAALPLFLTALAGLGLLTRRGRPTA